jgi:hypothetical protein
MSDSTPATECTIPQPGPSAEHESSCGLLAVAALARPDAHVNSALDYPLRSCDGEPFHNPVREGLPTIHELGYQFRTNFSTIHPIRKIRKEKRAQL